MENHSPQSSNVAKATMWSFLLQLTAKIIPPITSMILARVFAPEVFGLIATVNMVTSFAETFSEAGFQKYLIRNPYTRQEELYKDASVAFWTQLAISLALWLAIGLLSDPLCALLGNTGANLALIVACAQLPLSSLSGIQTAVYQRDYNFRRPFWGQMASSVTNMAVTLGLAFSGVSYWAIIIGNLCGYAVRTAVLSFGASWQPRLYYSLQRLKSIFSFSMWVLAESMAVWLTSWFDSFIISNRMNDHDLGIYKNSQSLVNSLLAIPQYAVTNVLMVNLSKSLDDPALYNRNYLTGQRLLAFLLLPAGVGVFLYRKLAVQLALGPGWEDATFVIGLWSLASVLRILLVSINSAVFVSKGKPRLSLYCQLLDIAFLIPSCIIGIQYGLQAFVIIRCVVRLDILIPSLYITSRLTGIRIASVLKNLATPLLATGIMAAAALVLQQLGSGMLWDFLSIFICICIYGTTLLMIAKEDVAALLRIVQKKR